jgi:hypothetical protein
LERSQKAVTIAARTFFDIFSSRRHAKSGQIPLLGYNLAVRETQRQKYLVGLFQKISKKFLESLPGFWLFSIFSGYLPENQFFNTLDQQKSGTKVPLLLFVC